MSVMSKGLTAKQQAILAFLRAETARRGFPPTIREIGARFGLRSTGSVRDHLRALERKGHIGRRHHLSRGIVLAAAPRPPRPAPRPAIPLLGDIAAGPPQLAIESAQDSLPLDPALFGGGELFALRVRGDSMRDAGILEGDLVLVRRDPSPRNGEIVVAMIGDEATVKRFFREKRQIVLRPENPHFKPITVTETSPELQILGRVVGVYRDIG
jgi:repressor LexA